MSPHSSQCLQQKILYSGHIAYFLVLSSDWLYSFLSQSTVSLHPLHVLQLTSSSHITVSRLRKVFIGIEPEISAGNEKRITVWYPWFSYFHRATPGRTPDQTSKASLLLNSSLWGWPSSGPQSINLSQLFHNIPTRTSQQYLLLASQLYSCTTINILKY